MQSTKDLKATPVTHEEAAEQEFFLTVLPGLEDLAARELRAWFPTVEVQIEHGGLSVIVPLEIGLSMNRALKIPTRILLRAARFTCSDFPKLYKKILSFPWETWVTPDFDLEVHVSTAGSRLKIKKRVEQTCLDAWHDRQKKLKVSATGTNKLSLHVRLLNNLCSLSLDTSGERLHKRGAREWIGTAPLRETLGAALIELVGSSTTGGDANVVVVDPLMGSGTILLEAAGRDHLVEDRDYAFEGWSVAGRSVMPPPPTGRPRIRRLVGLDNDAPTLAAARRNLTGRTFGLEIDLQDKELAAAEVFRRQTFGEQVWVIANPPYGKRLKIEGAKGPYFANLFAQSERAFQPDRACFLLPVEAASGRLILPAAWKVLAKRRLSNGGIPIFAFLFGRKTQPDLPG